MFILFPCDSRKLLYSLSEDIIDSELKQVKFLLEKILPRRKREEHIVSAPSEFYCEDRQTFTWPSFIKIR